MTASKNESCIADINNWMTSNRPKLNPSKYENQSTLVK